jgi:hypothetical protein
VRSATSPEDIRILADRFRQMAGVTGMPEYSQLMAQAASDLEQHAAALETPDRIVVFRLTADARPSACSFGDTTVPLSGDRYIHLWS